MLTITDISALKETVTAARLQGKRVGFVPTMGFLHKGHMSLIEAAKQNCEFVIASIFVNPLQFGPNEDFEAYPRNFDSDSTLLDTHGCDILFAPDTPEMYPNGTSLATIVEVSGLSQHLCGKSRPTHFRGVTTVVSKLLHIVQPDIVYFGQKDGQQLAIIRRMVQDLNFPVEVVGVETVREPDGLAKSSRNVYLTKENRAQAPILYRTLCWGLRQLKEGNRDGDLIQSRMAEFLNESPGVQLDYVDIVALDTLQHQSCVSGETMLVVAAYVGKARLIDNIQLNVSNPIPGGSLC